MEKETKYRLRDYNIPYYFEETLSRNPNVLVMYEMYDGKDVKWGVREDKNGICDKKYCRSTPIFDNLVDDRYGLDQERIIYLKDNRFVIHGKLNNSEVLCKISENRYLDKHLVKIEDFGGKDVVIRKENDEKVIVYYKKDGLDKRVFFDCEEFRIYSNEFDVTYVDSCFLKSYLINDKIRLLAGKLNTKTGVVKPYGYDINNNEFITFPLDENGLINELEMISFLNEDKVIGFDKEEYINMPKYNLILLLQSLKIDGFKVLNELSDQNKSKIKIK